MTKPKFFKTPAEFSDWLLKNHDSTSELLIGFHKKDSGKKSITYPEALDEALCFGWIDGVRKIWTKRVTRFGLYTTKAEKYLEPGKRKSRRAIEEGRPNAAFQD